MELDGKTGYAVDENGNLVVSMQETAGTGSKVYLGGNGMTGENVQFKMVYRNMSEMTTAEYYHANSFVNGGGFFQVFRQQKEMGSLYLADGGLSNKQLFDAAYNGTPFYYAMVVNMNTFTGKADYAVWKCTSLENALSKNDLTDTADIHLFGTGVSLAGENATLTDISLCNIPSVAGASGDIVLYEISLGEYVPVEITNEFKYDSSNFKNINLSDKTGYSLDESGNLVISMQETAGAGSRVSLGGEGMSGENVQFKMVYRNMNEATKAEYYHGYSFVNAGGHFQIFRQQKEMGGLYLTEGGLGNKQLFDAVYNETPFYYTILVSVNTITGKADYVVWKCTSLENALAKNDFSDTSDLHYSGSGTSLAGENAAFTDISLCNIPAVAGVSGDIVIYEISLFDAGLCTISNPVLSENAGVVTATVDMYNSTDITKNYTLIIVAYGSDNNMLAFNHEPVTSYANSGDTSDFVTLAKPSGTTSVKAFVWNTLSGLKPVGASEPLDGK